VSQRKWSAQRAEGERSPSGSRLSDSKPPNQAPPLRPLGLVLHRDGRLLHEGQPIRNARLRAAFERGVRYLPAEGKYVVTLGYFRGQLDVEECGFFVRSVDLATGTIALSDGAKERLDAASLRVSALDADALLCTVKRDLVPNGLPARFRHSAQAELLLGVEETGAGVALRIGGALHPLPGL
jgi:hypothetical protein